ncbi:MAG: hypothetical protein ACREAC_26750, partial [Blastocatellia bacterium]
SESELLGRLSEAHRERLSALMVGSSMEDTGAARALAISYANSIVRRNRDRVVEGLTRSAANGNEQDAIRAAQAVIALRRETRDH